MFVFVCSHYLLEQFCFLILSKSREQFLTCPPHKKKLNKNTYAKIHNENLLLTPVLCAPSFFIPKLRSQFFPVSVISFRVSLRKNPIHRNMYFLPKLSFYILFFTKSWHMWTPVQHFLFFYLINLICILVIVSLSRNFLV